MVGHRSGWAGGVALAAIMAFASPVLAASAKDAQAYIAHARALIAKGDLKGAEIELRNAVRLNPGDANVHVTLAEIYFNLGNLPAAEAEARLARQDKGPPDTVDPILAQTLVSEGKLNELFDAVTPGKRAAKAESVVRLELGLAHLMLGELKEAEPLLKDAVKLDGRSVPARDGLAQLLLREGDSDGATGELARARSLDPNDVTMLRLTAEIALAKGDRAGAIDQFGAILAKHPDDVQTLLDRANALMSVGKLDAAAKDIAAARKLSPENLVGNFMYALYLAKKGELKQADDVLTTISQYFNNFPDGYYLEGAVEYSLGEYAEAQANLTKYSVRNPTFAPARRLLALIAARQRDWKSVINTLEPVAKDPSAGAATLALLARAYMATGKRDEAVALLQNAAQSTSDQKDATQLALIEMQIGQTAAGLSKLKNLAATPQGVAIAGPVLVLNDLRSGKVAEAAAEAQAMVARDKDDVMAQDLLGIVRMSQQHYNDAIAIFRALADNNPNLIAASRNLASALIAAGHPDQGRQVLDALLKQHPDDVPSLMSLAQLDAVQKNYDAAADLFARAEKAAPKDATPGIRRLQLFALEKKWDDARAAARDLEGQFPANGNVINAVIDADLAAGDKQAAVAQGERLTEAYPQSAPAFVRYAELQEAAGNKADARQSLMKAHDLDPLNGAYVAALVQFDFANGGLDAALATAKSLAGQDPVVAALLEAEALRRGNRADVAAERLATAFKQHPDVRLAVAVAQTEFATGKHESAETLLVDWLKNHPGNPAATLALADLYLADNDYDKAQPLYEAMRTQLPEDANIVNDLADIYAHKNDPRALAMATDAYYMAPNPHYADTLGWLMLAKGETADAAALLENAGKSLPNDLAVQYHFAVALDREGNKAGARTVLERIVNSSSPFDGKADAEKLLSQLRQG